jgi:hypothetical protein
MKPYPPIEVTQRGDSIQYSMIDEIDIRELTAAEAAHIVDRMIAAGTRPADMSALQREAVRIMWAELERKLRPIHATFAAFAAALSNAAPALCSYARAAEVPAPSPFPGSRPAWQRRR